MAANKKKQSNVAAASATPSAPTVKFVKTALFDKTMQRYRANVNALKMLRDFVKWKRDHPTEAFGGRDYPFVPSGALRGYRHARLIAGDSVVYTINGSNPITIVLYGIFSHEVLGTGNTSNPNRLESNRQAFKNTKPTGEFTDI